MFKFPSGLAALLLAATVVTPAQAKPSFVMIVADDMGWNDIGYHESDVLTPQLDKLAADGVKLSFNYVYPTCSPTRVMLLSGRNASRFGVSAPIAGKSRQALPLEATTVAEALQSAGYATGLVGKWHLGLRPEVGPRKYGFESTYGYLHGQVDPYTHLYKFGDTTWHRNDKFIEEQGHATDLLAKEAVRFIGEQGEQPFFLYVAFSVPHYPLDEPQEWLSKYEGRIGDKSRRLYAASLTHMDAAVGQIVTALDEHGRRDDTYVIFTSDNGGQKSWSSKTQYKGRYADKPHRVLGDNAPLRGWKGSLYEGGVRVPGFVNGPELKPATCDAVVSAADWMPTMLRQAGVKVDTAWQLDGIDVWPQLAENKPGPTREIYWDTGREKAVRRGDWKLIRGAQQVQLFNIARDPLEEHEVSAAEPEIVERLQRALAKQEEVDRQQ